MVRCLLRNVVASGAVRKVPVAGVYFAQDRIEGLLDSGGSNMPATQVELDYPEEAFNRVVDSGYGEKHLGVAHEVGDALQHAARLKDKGGQHYPAQVGARSELRDNMRQNIALVWLDHEGVIFDLLSAICGRPATCMTVVVVSTSTKSRFLPVPGPLPPL